MSRDERGSSVGRSDNMPFHIARSNISNSRYAKVMRTEKEEKGTNIQVVVRCRGRTQKEIAEKIPVIVDAVTNSQDITVKMTNKTYHFDRVFGQEATQQHMYDEVVSPILQEMLMGYNCTIFAYGQTGTGKTYTMEGNLDDQEGYISRDAGIIPRTLYNLFDALDQEDAEYAVRMSSIELYNEELKDLLNPDDDRPKLRIFEDPNGSGVIVQGLEESLINSAEDGIRTVQIASRNRRIAATKCNEKSSRSHCVYTLTVHIKETLADGEELLKVGKLNLVDLAGSENIGRSGAENARAREAGLINQSLLTLGRVINHLVEHSIHVPYRESKLTRLLRDSLGGRTKTCIIATISTAKIHYEEIMSTLDYASRAKNIRNKPEVNQRMTKKELIKEYIHEIERLKSDLQATREKNGVFMSSDSYRLLLDENQSKKDQVEEITKEIEVFKDSVQRLTKEVEQKAKLLIGKQKELREVNDKLQETTKWLQKVQDEHEKTKSSLAEQIVLRKYHEEYGDKLQSLATKTISTLQNTVQDNKGLFKKLDRQQSVQDENRAVLQAFKGDFDMKAQSIFDEMLQFKSLIDNMQSELQEKAKDHATGLQKSLSTINHGVENRLKALENDTDRLHNLAKEGGAAQTGLYDVLMSLQKDIEQSTRKTKEVAKQEADAFMKVTNTALQKFYDQLTAKQSLLSDMLAVYVNGMKRASSEQLEHLEQMRTRFASGLENEKTFIQMKEDELKQIVETQQENRSKAKKQLMHDISLLLAEYDSEHHHSLQQSMHDVQTSLHSNAAMLGDLHYDHEQQVEQLVKAEKSKMQAVEEHRSKVVGQIDSFANFKRDIEDLGVEQNDYHDRMQALRDELSEKLSLVNEKLGSSVQAARSKQDQVLNVHAEEISKMQRTNLSVRTGVSSRVSDIISQSNEQVQSINGWVEDNKEVTEKHRLRADNHIEQLQNEVKVLLRSKVKNDISTGATPTRKNYRIPASLTPRLSNEDMIRRLQSTNAETDESKLLLIPSPEKVEEEYSAKPVSQIELPKSVSKSEPKYSSGLVTIKQEKDTVYTSDIQQYPASITAKYQSMRTMPHTIATVSADKSRTVSSEVGNNESALKDKTNGNKLNIGQADSKLLKRRLPNDVTDNLYKRRRAAESNFWRK
ncbi:hypothetical protein INT43_005472 [Umbelopsis isabellina]|uniref:Kinesin motor domain-containing protein n=1 Tax=Mortierella isabellina TaxID=91625 RepID=A0A8H7PLK2_MORIS|nr:hypothetical protein INT43_005472 [Umbelopsis isabellina]